MRRSLLALALLVSVPAYAGSYEMKDLEALEKQEAWQEALDHLGDIPPSKRNDAWNRIAEKSAAALLAKLDEKDERGSASYGRHFEEPAALVLSDKLVGQYPTLKKSKVFHQARVDAALKGYKNTFQFSSHNQSDDAWLDSLKKFVAADNGATADLNLRAGKLITGRLVAYIAMPFFKPALASNGVLCKDADVKATIVSSLVDNVWMADGKAMSDKCWGDVKDGLIVEVKKKHADEAKKNACPLLEQHKAAPPECKPEE